jgi:hypothetical protein
LKWFIINHCYTYIIFENNTNRKRVIVIVPAVLLVAIFVNGLSLAQVASGCDDRIDAGPAWMKGYHDAQ